MAFSPHSFMFQPLHQDHHHHHLLSHPPQLFNGVGNGGDDELSDDKSHHDEKKIKRLNMEQVKALEKSFELGNKIEPDRKLQLAKDLGLKPRQIAIWFQNRRARYKNKQLEKDYDSLKKLFEALKSDNHTLKSQNYKLTAQLMCLKTKDSNEIFRAKNENEGSCSDNGCDVNLDISRTTLRGSSTRPATTMGSSKPDLHCHQVVQDDQSLACHMFNVVDEQQQGFWPWRLTNQSNFH